MHPIVLAAVLLVLGLVSASPIQEGLNLPVQSKVPQSFAEVESVGEDQRPKLIGSPRTLDGDVEPSPPHQEVAKTMELTREKRQIVYWQYYTTEDSDIVEKDEQIKMR